MSSLQMKRMMNAVSVKKKATIQQASQAQDSKGRRRPHSQPQDTQQGSKLSRGLI